MSLNGSYNDVSLKTNFNIEFPLRLIFRICIVTVLHYNCKIDELYNTNGNVFTDTQNTVIILLLKQYQLYLYFG